MATTFDYNGPPVNVTNGMAMKVGQISKQYKLLFIVGITIWRQKCLVRLFEVERNENN